MFPGPELYAVVLFLTVLPAAYLVRAVWKRLDRPGGSWLVVTLIGMCGWSVCWSLMLFFDGYIGSLWSFNAVVFFASITTLGWLFVTVEYTWQTQVGYRVVGPFLIVPTVVQVLVWTNPLHQLVWRPGTVIDAHGVVNPVHGIGFFLHSGYSYVLVVASIVLLLVAFIEREGLYRKQAALLLAGGTIPAVTSVAFVFGLIPTDYLNPTPIGFLVGATIWGWALFRFQLLKTVPVARRLALAEMNEGVLIVDESGVITDSNEAVHEIFGLDEDPTGRCLDNVLSSHPELLDRIDDGPVTDERITLRMDGEQRHLLVNKSCITHDAGTSGWVFVFNDRTALFRYEEDLELLKGILTRVLRHDIRNRLNVIRAHGELLAQQTGGQQAREAETIVRTADVVIETAEKAKAIESLVEADRPLYDTDLARVARETGEWATDQFPDAVVDIETPEEAWVRADERLPLAIRSLVENAIQHNDSETPSVRVGVECDEQTVTLTVEDDGPGIAKQERRVFQNESGDQLDHSTGLGLWLVNWVVRNSRGTVDVSSSDTGTRFQLTFSRVFDVTSDSPNGASVESE